MPEVSAQKARHLRNKGPLMVGIFLTVLINLAFVGGVAALVLLVLTKDRVYGFCFIGALVAWVICLVARYLFGSSCKCPLCHGQWMIEPRCHMNEKARKYPFFKHRTSLMIDAALRWNFRCQYCGTPYRLKR
jgi:hypothetical protein